MASKFQADPGADREKPKAPPATANRQKAMRLDASGGDRERASYIPESARPDADHKIAVFLMGQANAIYTASTIARNAGEVLAVAEPSEVAIWHISAT